MKGNEYVSAKEAIQRVETAADNRSTSLDYRFLSSMQGSLGIGANLNKWSDADFATAKTLIAQYKQLRPTIQNGSEYRLISPEAGSEHSVTESLSADGTQAAIFAFLHSSQLGDRYPRIYPRGLEPAKEYTIHALVGTLDSGIPQRASGEYWMHRGIDISLRGGFPGDAVHPREICPALSWLPISRRLHRVPHILSRALPRP
jgi:alpha-galactosidase